MTGENGASLDGRRNIEIKCPLPDRAAIEETLRSLGARRQWTRRQVDTFFGVDRGWLKLREPEGAPAELISYERSIEDAGPRPSSYDVVRVEDPTIMKRLLARALVIEAVVEKERTLWRHGRTRVHLDRVKGLGEFLELETVVSDGTLEEAQAETDRLIERLGLDRSSFLSVPYRDLARS